MKLFLKSLIVLWKNSLRWSRIKSLGMGSFGIVLAEDVAGKGACVTKVIYRSPHSSPDKALETAKRETFILSKFGAQGIEGIELPVLIEPLQFRFLYV